MPDIMMRLGKEMLVLDGAMGTMLQRAGMPPGECPELINVTEPEMVAQVLDFYKMAGSDCAITNSFGGTRVKLEEHGLGDRVVELNRAAVRIARRHGGPHVLADMGPTGLVMEPLGPATFDEVFAQFAEQAAALASENPDAIFIETMTDIAEARCAVLAAKSVCDLPVFASVTFGAAGVMDLSGTPPEVAAVVLEAAGADAVGLNCGLGPAQMFPLAERMVRATDLPVIVQPNAGMPRLDDSGATVFPGTPDEMGAFADAARVAGVAAVGSCCGSSPAFTGAIYDAISGRDVCVVPSELAAGLVLAGPRGLVALGAGLPVRAIGERINPTGKAALADSLRAGSMSIVRTFASEQADAGADLLDVNVGAAGVEATEALPKAVLALVGSSDLPLVLDTTDPGALEAALRVYPGVALINSVNGDPQSMQTVLPLAAKYGAGIVVLALDEAGIPADVSGRMAVVDKVRSAAAARGIADRALVVDALVMTAATDEAAPAVTLGVLEHVKAEGLSSVLGVSNVSHGLPQRPLLNAAFLAAACARGLDAAIVNPNDDVVMEALKTANQARANGYENAELREDSWRAWLAAYDASIARASGASDDEVTAVAGDVEIDPRSALEAAIARGDSDAAPGLAEAVINSGIAPQDVIGQVLTPTIQRLGDAYGRGEVFLPQMMIAADAMKAAVAVAKKHLPEGGGAAARRVAFATVKGDIHSIGKDICVSLLESQGIEVDDLGVDVALERVVEASRSCDAVCLSALMTTTLPAMRATAEAVMRDVGKPVFVGGAVVTEDWASSIGAGYSADAPGCVRVVSAALGAAEDLR